MISDIKIAINDKLREIYPHGYMIYNEDLPEDMGKPSFLITTTSLSYNKIFQNKYATNISYDISYFSDQSAIRTDLVRVQEELVKAFHLDGTYQVMNKIARITENVLHFTFDIQLLEKEEKVAPIMLKQEVTTNL